MKFPGVSTGLTGGQKQFVPQLVPSGNFETSMKHVHSSGSVNVRQTRKIKTKLRKRMGLRLDTIATFALTSLGALKFLGCFETGSH